MLTLVDVRTDEDFDADPTLLPGARRRPHAGVNDWAPEVAGRSVVIIRRHGGTRSERMAVCLAFVTMLSVAGASKVAANADIQAHLRSATTSSAAATSSNEETLYGIVALVDERNNKVTVRLPSDETIDLKVVDGLLFDALRYGDAVRVTVRIVGGAKEIVDLIRE
ncbi:hypothetical protein [Tardiphaga robiniae]|uniref:hypothetical protein n=1 Tax=Tardiphaga robiniae TaxID=943830 RepID=UPI00195E24B5|nr:hypothetical protein [Tardiphaga robiniae]